MATNSLKQSIIDAALDYVYPTPEQLVEDFAKRFALENTGQRLVDFLSSVRVEAGRVYASCYSSLYQQSESDEMAARLDAERKGWLKDGRRVVKLVQKKRLPLTMRNAEDAWNKRGPFAG